VLRQPQDPCEGAPMRLHPHAGGQLLAACVVLLAAHSAHAAHFEVRGHVWQEGDCVFLLACGGVLDATEAEAGRTLAPPSHRGAGDVTGPQQTF